MSMQLNKSILIKKLDNAKKYLEESKNEKALKILNKLIKETPTYDEIWLYLGITKRRLGNIDGAIDSFKMAIEINSTMLEAWGLLTITLIDQGNIDMAREIIDKASQLNPYNSKIQFFRNNLVRIYKKFGPFF